MRRKAGKRKLADAVFTPPEISNLALCTLRLQTGALLLYGRLSAHSGQFTCV
jgi:hypothetical protein